MTYIFRKWSFPKLCGKHFWVIFVTCVFFWPQIAKATDPPNLTSPPDNSQTSDKSPKLTWEYSGGCPDSGSCFRVEVDNSPDFSSPEKSTYTNSLSYSPQLTEGSWNWRLKAKDKSDKWSDWSKIFKFSIGAQASNPSPTSQETSSPSQSTNDSSKPQTSFEVKDTPSEVSSNQEFEAQVLLVLPKNPNLTFYLKAAFKKSDSSNYFAETYSGNEWVKNNASYSKQFKIQTDSQGKWEGKIKARPDGDDSGFEDSGDYVLKIGRYSDSGSGPAWSNEVNIKINSVDKPGPSPSAEAGVTEDEDSESEVLAATRPSPSRDYEIKIASVAGEATMSNNIISEEEHTRVLEDKKVNWLLIILGVAIVAGGAGFTYFKLKKRNANT